MYKKKQYVHEFGMRILAQKFYMYEVLWIPHLICNKECTSSALQGIIPD